MITRLVLQAGFLVAAALSPLAPAVHAQSESVAGEAPSPLYAAAYEMTDLQVGGVQFSPTLKQVMRDQMMLAFRSDADFQELEAEFPGVTVAVIDAIVPVAIRQTEATMPALIDQLARLYASEMVADEIAVATQWYSSEAFARVSTQMESNFDLQKIINDALQDETATVSSEALNTMEMNSAARTASAISLEDRAALLRFSATSAYRKLENLKSRALAIETAWTNESSPEDDAELDAITTKALEDFTGLDLSGAE